MLLSREKINQLSKLIMDNLDKNEMVDFIKEENDIRLQIVKLITDELKLDDLIDESVRATLASYSKKIYEGTAEWEVMYKKLYEEEMQRRRIF